MQDFLSQANISYVTPENGTAFDEIQLSHTGLHKSSQPAIITLPETAAQVAAIVKQCITSGQEFIVRGRGHDCHGRYSASGVVTIDLRKLSSVTISSDKTTATIGGGTQALEYLSVLETHGLYAPSGVCGEIGYTGWCIVGGLGPLSTPYGIGSDQIVGATVVNARGDLVEADAGLLRGLRGGGGCLAVIVELVVKVYPIQELQLARIRYDTAGVVRDAVLNLFTNLGNLLDSQTQPINLSLEAHYTDRGPGRPHFGLDFVWNGARTEECVAWHEMVKKLGPLRPGASDFALETTTMRSFVAEITSGLPLVVYGKTHSPSIRRYSPQMAAIFADMAAAMPKTCVGGFATHTLRGDSPSCAAGHPDSVSPYRKPLMVVEILGFGVDEDAAPECIEWARVSHDRINKSDVLLPESYLALTSPDTMNLGAIYGSNLQELEKLKREYDPENVFKHSLPKLL